MTKKHAPKKPIDAVVGSESPKPLGPELIREEIRSPAFFSAYANDAQLQMTPWDMRLTWGEISIAATTEMPRVVVNQLGEVRVSPSLAKKLAMIMIQQIRTYEERFGIIPMPKD
jgi:hypothetical protein